MIRELVTWFLGQVLQSHPPVTGALKWEILGTPLGSAPEGAPGNRGARGVLPRVLREIGDAPGSAPESALSVGRHYSQSLFLLQTVVVIVTHTKTHS